MTDSEIKLYVSCHKQNTRIPENPLIVPVHVGSAIARNRFPGMVEDDSGDNISFKNKNYCELTAQYWAWKNDEADYYGFLHYRRYFNFSEKSFPIRHEPFIFGDVVFDANDFRTLESIGFNESRMREVITSHDFIAPQAIATPDGASVYEQYKLSVGHHIEDFDTVLDILRRRYPEIWNSAEKYLAQEKMYVCNMFVMRKDLFEAYSTMLFDVLAEHEKLCDFSHYSPVARRVSGYLGERLCGIFLAYLFDNGYNGIELQRVYFRDTDCRSASISHVVSDVSQGKARVAFGDITRGGGYIYASISIPGLAWNCEELTYSATSYASDGKTLPAKVVITAEHGPVLVLPIFNVDQRVEVSVRRDGELIAIGFNEYGFRTSALTSKKNTLIKNATALAIRNCDKLPLFRDTLVKVCRIIPDTDGVDILQGQISIPLMPDDPVDAYLYVVAVDQSGSEINLEDWICTSDELVLSDDDPSCRFRRVDFSLKVPRVDRFCIWARLPECGLSDGFHNFYGDEAENMRNHWRSVTEPASEDRNYDSWFHERHRSTQQELAWQRSFAFENPPCFSIVVPLYKTPIEFFCEMVNSVLAQTYRNWQLILVNASPDAMDLSRMAHLAVEKDDRITLVSLEQNFGITENTNYGIQVASGDFVCFLDHDDLLEPDALYWYATALRSHDDIDMLYCDEDKVRDGWYCQPNFKSDWNPELLLSMNYVCHFLAVRRSVLDDLDLPGSEYDGSQDWHMAFRVGEKARRVFHVPRVLYHWRIHRESTASHAEQKSYTLDSSRLSVESHLNRCGIDGSVVESPIAPRRFVVELALSDKPLVSIIIPNKDSLKVLNRCLVSIKNKTSYRNIEIIIVENNSTDPDLFSYYKEIQAHDGRIRVVVLKDMESFNFSKIINYGAKYARGEYLLLLNNDTQVISSDWIERLLSACAMPGVGVAGARLLFPDGTIQHAGVTYGFEGPCHLHYLRSKYDLGNMESALNMRDVGAVTGACLLTRRSEFEALGGMDEDLAVNYNDIDYCLKVIESGSRVVFCPLAELIHYESVSRGSEKSGKKALRFRSEKGKFMQRWPEVFEFGDPLGNPNLEPGNVYEKIKWSEPVKGR